MVDDQNQNGSDRTIGRDAPIGRVSDGDSIETTDGSSPVDDLIINTLSGNGSPFEEERLRRWRESDPGNEDRYQEMARVWALTEPEPVTTPSAPPPVEVILAAAGSGHDGPDLSFPQRRRKPTWAMIGLLAASVAAVGLGIGTVLSGPEPAAEYAATSLEALTLTLADGSFVRLAPEATLQEWEVPGGREVSLEGKAFFAVARDEDRPFSVRTGAGTVRVLGTRFQIIANEAHTETAVVEGLVEVTNDHGSVDVPAGAISVVTPEDTPSMEEVEDILARLDWPGGVMVYQATPLEQVVEEVSRFYGRELRVSDPDLARRRVTAWFQGEPFEAVAESLCLVTEAVCEEDGSNMVMGMGGGSESR